VRGQFALHEFADGVSNLFTSLRMSPGLSGNTSNNESRRHRSDCFLF
jgi:hypothetical protein